MESEAEGCGEWGKGGGGELVRGIESEAEGGGECDRGGDGESGNGGWRVRRGGWRVRRWRVRQKGVESEIEGGGGQWGREGMKSEAEG